jgi:flagellar biosynthesis protein FlhA
MRMDWKKLFSSESLYNNRGLIVVIGVVVIILLMIIPIPALFLDILFALMLSIGLMVLLISMYLENVLQFSIFPGLLLVITLFRIGLNIATTRLILSGSADIPDTIETFATFVTGGNLIVGVVIFIILMVVQFSVITKGAGRIAEVAARFTLDAMPGKQMAVDSDLNAGIITEAEAKTRRKDISREADFYGAMDGASKFVKGDAVAGLIIVGINIVGGLITGMTLRNMEFIKALETYTILTIGDGLVTQLPALMISTASGLIVARAASGANLGEEMVKQFTQNSKALMVAGIVICLIGMIPGMSHFAFLTIGIGLFYMGYTMQKKAERVALADASGVANQQAEEEFTPQEEKIEDYLKVDQMELEIGYGLIPLVDKNQGGDLLERITMLRRQMATEIGIIVPPIRIRDNIQLQPSDYAVKIKGIQVGDGSLMSGSYLAMNPGAVSQQINGIPTVEPAFGLPALWITESQKEIAELSGYTVIELPAVLATHLTELIRTHAAEILSRQDVKKLIDNVKAHSPAAVDDLIPALLNVGEVQIILSNLLKEKVSIRDLPTLFEVMADSAKINKELTYITEQCRQSLNRQICATLRGPDGELGVMTLHPELEQLLEASVQKTERGPRLILRPEMVGRLFDAVQPHYERSQSFGEVPIIACSPNVRFPLKKMLEGSFPQLNILAYSEIALGFEVKSIGVVALE